jgi:hypothetical protein
METGNSISGSKVGDSCADGVDYACNIIALVDTGNYFLSSEIGL